MKKMAIERIKSMMAEAYSRKAREYGVVRNEKFDAFLQNELEHFINSVKKVGTTVIDLGSGPGNEALYLKEAGLQPVCVDIAPGMIEQCRKKGLEAYVMDFYNLDFPDESFAGAWMSFSLLHVPKGEAEAVIKEVYRILVTNGVFYVSLFEGEGEGLRKEDVSRYGCPRYFAYYRLEELENLLSPYFEIRKSSRLDISPRPTISFECQKIKL
jgi:ubiquinone/menaquinone biosynthesis C-methylase UbiE